MCHGVAAAVELDIPPLLLRPNSLISHQPQQATTTFAELVILKISHFIIIYKIYNTQWLQHGNKDPRPQRPELM